MHKALNFWETANDSSWWWWRRRRRRRRSTNQSLGGAHTLLGNIGYGRVIKSNSFPLLMHAIRQQEAIVNSSQTYNYIGLTETIVNNEMQLVRVGNRPSHGWMVGEKRAQTAQHKPGKSQVDDNDDHKEEFPFLCTLYDQPGCGQIVQQRAQLWGRRLCWLRMQLNVPPPLPSLNRAWQHVQMCKQSSKLLLPMLPRIWSTTIIIIIITITTNCQQVKKNNDASSSYPTHTHTSIQNTHAQTMCVYIKRKHNRDWTTAAHLDISGLNSTRLDGLHTKKYISCLRSTRKSQVILWYYFQVVIADA